MTGTDGQHDLGFLSAFLGQITDCRNGTSTERVREPFTVSSWLTISARKALS